MTTQTSIEIMAMLPEDRLAHLFDAVKWYIESYDMEAEDKDFAGVILADITAAIASKYAQRRQRP